jgi:hypothetical protein
MTQNDQPLGPVAEEAEAIKRIAGTRDGALCFTAICAAFWRACST